SYDLALDFTPAEVAEDRVSELGVRIGKALLVVINFLESRSAEQIVGAFSQRFDFARRRAHSFNRGRMPLGGDERPIVEAVEPARRQQLANELPVLRRVALADVVVPVRLLRILDVENVAIKFVFFSALERLDRALFVRPVLAQRCQYAVVALHVRLSEML